MAISVAAWPIPRQTLPGSLLALEFMYRGGHAALWAAGVTASSQSWDRSRLVASSLHGKQRRSCNDAMPGMKQKICDGPLPFGEDWECAAGTLQSVLSRCQVWLCDMLVLSWAGLHVAEVSTFDMLFVPCWSWTPQSAFRRVSPWQPWREISEGHRPKGVSSKEPRSWLSDKARSFLSAFWQFVKSKVLEYLD